MVSASQHPAGREAELGTDMVKLHLNQPFSSQGPTWHGFQGCGSGPVGEVGPSGKTFVFPFEFSPCRRDIRLGGWSTGSPLLLSVSYLAFLQAEN